KAVKIDPKTGAVIPGSGDLYNGLVIPGTGFPSSAKGRFPESTSGTYDYLFRGGKYPSYYSNIQWGQIQPRVGLAYQWNNKTVIRAGGGRFFTRLGQSDSVFLGGNPPFQPTANISFGNVDNPGGTSANSLPLTVTTQSRVFKNPEAWNWNFTVERDFYFKSVLSVAYVGRRGLHLQREANINQPTTDVRNANLTANLDAVRPFLGYNSVRETDNVASSRYNSLQVSWNRRFSQGIQFGAAYTLSKSSDDGSDQRDIIPDTYFAHNLYGPSTFDTRHILIASFLYDLPLFRSQNNLAGKILGGWQVSGIAQFQTGQPNSVTVGNDYAGVGQDGSLQNGGGQFWVKNGNPGIVGQLAHNGANDPALWFTTTNKDGSPIFTAPAKGTFNLQNNIRDIIYNPGFNNWNLGLFKAFRISEKTGFEFRAEGYDAFNHPNWNGADFNPTSATFGKITGKNNDHRELQLSLRFFF
ncbi:MAG: TonB-dependent receptor, partial [Bryobacteraceae bacterium]